MNSLFLTGSYLHFPYDSHTRFRATDFCEVRRDTAMKNATILVVDDEMQIRRVLRATLSQDGYDVIEAKRGEEAIHLLIRNALLT